MSYQIIRDKIDNGHVVLLDGGTGSEIERQGVRMNELAWCGIAHLEQPEVVRRVHESYIHAGADVIIANTFGTAPHILRRLGLEDQIAEINQSAVRLALQARDNTGQDVCVAASMSSTPAFDSIRMPTDDEAREGYLRQAELLVEAGAELIIAEMMRDIDNARIVVGAARSTGIPVWTGFSAFINDDNDVTNYVSIRGLELEILSFKKMAQEVLSVGCDAAGVMHTSVHHTGPALTELNKLWGGPVFAYAESGHFIPPSWKFEDIISPQAYLGYARQWINQGVQVIGGCCGIGPEHIRVLRENLAVVSLDPAL